MSPSSTRSGTVLFLKFSGREIMSGSFFLSPPAISTLTSSKGSSLNVLT
jgi:hypothetical protein